jgi:hypothetical protein
MATGAFTLIITAAVTTAGLPRHPPRIPAYGFTDAVTPCRIHTMDKLT